MRREKTDKEVLQEVDGIGPKRSESLLSRFGSGREVYKRSTSNFASVAKTEGISEDTAREMFDRMDEAGVRDELESRGRSGGEVRGVARPTDIGREADGEYARPESAPDIAPAPVARNTRNGEFGLDPFDLTSGGVGESVELLGGDGNDDSDSSREDRSLVTEYGGIPPRNPTTELPGVGEATADKLKTEQDISTVEGFYENREQAQSVLSEQFRKEAREVAAYSIGGTPAANKERRRLEGEQ